MNEKRRMLVVWLILFFAALVVASGFILVVAGFVWGITGIVKDAGDPGHKADAVLEEMDREEQVLQGADDHEKEKEQKAKTNNL